MKRLLTPLALALVGTCVARASHRDHSSEMPKKLAAIRKGADLHAFRTISVIVSSRRMDDPPLPVRAEKLHAQLSDDLKKTPFSLVSDSMAAQLNMELVIEPHQPLTPGSKQDAPYMFLLLRDHRNANVVYCGYQRVRFFYERALDQLVKDLLRNTGAGPVATGDVNACAKAAMRLPDVGL